MRKGLLTTLSLGLLFLIWQIIAWKIDNENLFPALPALIRTLGRLVIEPHFYQAIGTTLLRGCIGLVIALVGAGCTALLLNRSETMRHLFAPWLALMRSVPIISFILLALIFLHPDSIPLLIAFLTMYPLLTENLLKGLGQFRPEYRVMARQFQLGFWNRLFQIDYPQLKPFLFSGLASALGFGWRAIIMGEVLAQCAEGIGSEMKRAQLFIAVPELMAWTLMAILLGWLSDKSLSRLSAWQPPIIYVRKRILHKEERPMDIGVNHLSYTYGIRHFDYLFKAGKTYALSAPSGFGKTTLLRLLNGTLQPLSGTIVNRPGRIANVFQEPELLSHLSALENILLVQASAFTQEESKLRAASLLSALELEEHARSKPSELSYGQQQRVALARALAFPDPQLLLMDEPFKGLDADLRRRVIRYLLHWQKNQGVTLLFTTHSREEIDEMNAQTIALQERNVGTLICK